jgi:hypothetical protein
MKQVLFVLDTLPMSGSYYQKKKNCQKMFLFFKIPLLNMQSADALKKTIKKCSPTKHKHESNTAI